MAFSLLVDNQQLTDNALAILAGESDANFRQTPFVDGLTKAQGSKAMEDGGTVILKDIEFGAHSKVTEMTGRGYNAINTATLLTTQVTQQLWWRAVMPIIMADRERDENSGSRKIIDTVGKRTRNVQGEFTRLLEQQLLQGGVPGFSALNFLNGVDSANGILEAAVYASQSHTVGGIPKGTFASYPGFVNQWGNCGGSASSNGVAQLDYVTTAANNRSKNGIGMWMFSEAFANHMLRQARSYKRWVSEDSVDLGSVKFLWNGKAVSSSTYMPNAGSVTSVAGSEVSAYGLDTENMWLRWMKGRQFYLKPFTDIPGTETSIALLVCMAQLAPEHLGGSAIITGGDTF